MARPARRREHHRTAVVEGRAEVVIPLRDLAWSTGAAPRLTDLTRWLPTLTSFRAEPLNDAVPSVSAVVDPFSFALHFIGRDDAIEFTGTHDGPTFRDAVMEGGGIDVVVAAGIDVRRSKVADLDAAARSGGAVGGRVSAFVVETLA